MPIVGDKPTHGLRVRLVLEGTRYEGAAMTPQAEWPVRAEVSDEGDVRVETTAPGEIAEYVRRVVRIAAKDAKSDGRPLPRMLQRWRDR